MSGHSKWSQIKHKKGASDAKRSQLFSKLAREITIAAKSGSPDPTMNAQLRAVIERARASGLPKDNTERAIARAASNGEGANLEEFLYEAIGSGGVYILIEGITDNRQRTMPEIKRIVTRHDAKLVPQNSILWNFEKVWTDKGNDYHSKTPIETSAEDRERLIPLLDELMEHDDVQEVYTNMKIQNEK